MSCSCLDLFDPFCHWLFQFDSKIIIMPDHLEGLKAVDFGQLDVGAFYHSFGYSWLR